MQKQMESAVFSVPADFKKETLKQYYEFNQQGDLKIDETYGCLNPSILNSGRSNSIIPKVTIAQLQEYVTYSYSYNINFNYLINLSCTSNLELFKDSKKEIENLIRNLIGIGINRFTLSSHTFLPFFCDYKNIELSISTISQLYKADGLRFLKLFPNVKRICLPENINRNLILLKEIITLSEPLKLSVIVNNLCLLECPFRHQHYNYYSHGHPDVGPDPNIIACCSIRLTNPISIFKSPWIRPEDLNRYISIGVKNFKIAGRSLRNPNFIKMLNIYRKGHFEGNLIELFRAFSPNSFWDNFILPADLVNSTINKVLSKKRGCTGNECYNCNICGDLINEDDLIIDNANRLIYLNEYHKYLNIAD